MEIRINPSILSADFVNLQQELERISTADYVHVDVMDNHFVPNLTIGPVVVERIQQVSPVPLDLHLMIENPDRWAPEYAEFGAHSVTVHAEAVSNIRQLAKDIQKLGSRFGLAIKPNTKIEQYLEFLPIIDQLLIMTVEPGFGGQSFIHETMPKLKFANEFRTTNKLDFWLQVDGGITVETIKVAAANGADTFVAGSSVYKSDNPELAIATLRSSAHNHLS